MRGAELNAEKKARYAAIDKELSTLYNTFSDNVLHDEENYVTYLNDDQLDGLSDGFIKSAAAIATEKGKEGTVMRLPIRVLQWIPFSPILQTEL